MSSANLSPAFAGREAQGRHQRSLPPVSATVCEAPRKGVASALSLTCLPGGGEQGGLPLPLPAACGDGEDDTLRLQVIEQLQLTLDGNDSREVIAERTGFSLRQIGAWTSPSSGKNISLANTVQIVRATGSLRLLSWAAAACGMHLVNDDVVRDAAVGKKVREAMQALLGAA